jgi:hypothetical protein
MSKAAPYCVVLDANVWVAERMLQSSIGNALLYALTGAKASIGLPEVVELEVNRVLPEMAERAVSVIGREASLLRQLSGQNLLFTGPTALAIREGIAERWKQLAGLLERVPFSHEQAQLALARIIAKTPPCGENNEQFRDCCIWQASVSLAEERDVHLVTGDLAFYEGRKSSSGLAKSLRDELESRKCTLFIHASVRDFLAALGDTAAAVDEAAIGAAIIQSVTPYASDLAAEKDHFQLGAPRKPNINGFATPKGSLIAVSFDVSFALERVESDGDAERYTNATLSIAGECSYDPILHSVADVEIRSWSKTLDRSGGFSGSMSGPSSKELGRHGPMHIRRIS